MSEPAPVYATLTSTERVPCAHQGCFGRAELDGLCLVCHGQNDRLRCGPTPQLRPLGVAATATAVAERDAAVADLLGLCDAIRAYAGYPGLTSTPTLEQVMERERAARERWGS